MSEFLVKHRGVDISVGDDGTFRAYVGLDWLKADRLVDLKKQIEKAVKKTKLKVAVPVTILGRKWWENESGHSYRGASRWVSGRGVQHATLTGLRDRKRYTKVVMVDDRTGAISEVDRHDETNMVRRLTDAEAAEWVRIEDAYREAEHARYEFLKDKEVNPEELVKAALAEVVDRAAPDVEDVADLLLDGDPR